MDSREMALRLLCLAFNVALPDDKKQLGQVLSGEKPIAELPDYSDYFNPFEECGAEMKGDANDT